jgi:hypothetical protein
MSKQTHDESRRESGRKKQIKFRAEESLIEAFDESIEESRAGALRSLMRQEVAGASTTDTPRTPPKDEPLGTAYLTLCDICNADGVIRQDLAVTHLAATMSKRQEIIKRTVLSRLRDRGYLARLTDLYGNASYKLRGWDE